MLKKFFSLYKKIYNIKLTDLRYYIQSYTPNTILKKEWDFQYSSKHWEYLKGIDELAHYSVIIGYCHFFKNQGEILDVGCGEGILQERLQQYQYSRYVGIDISNEAILSAYRRQDKRTTFLCAEISDYENEESFDIIIFNEVLYYLNDPIGILKKYEKFLKKNGIIIISMYSSGRNQRVWRLINRFYPSIDSVLVKNNSSVAWLIMVLKPNVGN